jgi:hypothetical protein
MWYNISVTRTVGENRLQLNKIFVANQALIRLCRSFWSHIAAGSFVGALLFRSRVVANKSGWPRLTTGEFVKRARKIHGDKYDYRLTQYKNSKSKVVIICPDHGQFEQIPSSHLQGRGCSECGLIQKARSKVLPQKEIIRRMIDVHGQRYDYSQVVYKCYNKKVRIICKKHGVFKQSPSHHISGEGCPKCAIESHHQNQPLTTQNFIERATEVHKGYYDYSLVRYKTAKHKVTIICPEHGKFEQIPRYHIKGKGCSKCGGSHPLTTDIFIERADEVHDGFYDYSLVKYKNCHSKVTIICSLHGKFSQVAIAHLQGRGCPSCGQLSKGEEKIRKFFDRFGFSYTPQKRFEKCRDKKPLPFDFYIYLGGMHFLIEYDGEQHFKPVDHWGGKEYFEVLKNKDKKKERFAETYNFKLIRIPYTSVNVEGDLREKLEFYLGQSLNSFVKKRKTRKTQLFEPSLYRQAKLYGC